MPENDLRTERKTNKETISSENEIEKCHKAVKYDQHKTPGCKSCDIGRRPRALRI